jgi:HPt (histidine-containing phosphotransfer) domain-containing protein
MVQGKSPQKIKVVVDPELQDLIPGFLQNRRLDISKLQGASETDDFETILTLGHRMRGDGGGYGFAMISELGHAIETAAKDKDVFEVRRLVDELERYLDRVEVVYE